jgi:hypothetical protein
MASRTAPNARLSSRPTARSLPLSAPTQLWSAPASWLWRAVLGRRRYFRGYARMADRSHWQRPRLFSAFCFGAAVWRHLESGVPPPRIDVSRIPPWLLVAMNGFLALVALAALIGIWLAGHLACQPDRTSSTLAGYRFRSTGGVTL